MIYSYKYMLGMEIETIKYEKQTYAIARFKPLLLKNVDKSKVVAFKKEIKMLAKKKP